MKLSAKKRGEIYDLVHEHLMKGRLNVQEVFNHTSPVNHSKVDYHIAQLETPLAQALFRLLDKDYK